MVIVRGADQIAGVPFVDQFQRQPAREDGNIVGVRLNGGEHLSGMWLPRLGTLDLNLRGGKRPLIRHRIPCGSGERTPRNARNKLAALHRITSWSIVTQFWPARAMAARTIEAAAPYEYGNQLGSIAGRAPLASWMRASNRCRRPAAICWYPVRPARLTCWWGSA